MPKDGGVKECEWCDHEVKFAVRKCPNCGNDCRKGYGPPPGYRDRMKGKKTRAVPGKSKPIETKVSVAPPPPRFGIMLNDIVQVKELSTRMGVENFNRLVDVLA